MRRIAILLSLPLVLSLRIGDAEACTSIAVGRGASADGSTMVTYAADSHDLYGSLLFLPAARHGEGATRPIVDWDSGEPLGSIPEVPQTYSVVGNMNEHQLVIGETTFGGRKELKNPNGRIDYGSLIYVALQRARTAREAIGVIVDLAEKHGYRSTGESFSIADPREVWLMELIGKGPDRPGILWVARRVPEGMVTAHANQARIRTFPLKDPENCLYGPDVISFAREKGWFSGKDAEFSFADTYAPADAKTLRTCELRVWRVFDRLAPSKKLSLDYVKRVPGAQPLPLWIAPDRKVTPRELTALMRDHFEGTEFDLTQGIGAGPFGLPYRWRPLTWNVDGGEYVNERAIATQQTGFVFVSQSRASLPGPVGGLLWFGVDDAATSVFMPIYAGIREAPRSLAEGTGADLFHFSWDSAFWVFNWVANFSYLRYADMARDVRQAQQDLEGSFFERQEAIEKAALQLHATSPELARDYLTSYSLKQVELTVARWRKLGEELIVKFMDGNVKAFGKPTHPPYPESWYRRIVAEDGERLRMPKPEAAPVPDPAPVAAPR